MTAVAAAGSKPGFNFLSAVSKFSNGVKQAKEFAADCKAVKDFVLTHNSSADVEFQKANPLPPSTAPDYLQIVAYASRTIALTTELIEHTGKFAEQRLKEQNT